MRYCFPTATMLAWTSLNVTLHLHCLCWYSSSAPTPTFTDTIKTWTQELVKKIVKNTVEVLHSVAHDISLAAEWGWREDDFSCVLNASAEAIEQGNYPTTEGGCSSNSSANKRNRERCGSAVITTAQRLKRNILQQQAVHWMGQLNSSSVLTDDSINPTFFRGFTKTFLFLNIFIEENTEFWETYSRLLFFF